MQKNLPYLAIATVLIYAAYNAKFRNNEQQHPRNINKEYAKHISKHESKSHFEEELTRLKTDAYVKQYIIDVINHGSSQFDFKGGVMEGGFVSKEDAPKIACYVLELSGKKCKTTYPSDAAMFYTSVCGGCHGDDGKGVGGTYPNLTKNKLLGIKKREEYLKTMLTHSH
jgi:cytochrome c553